MAEIEDGLLETEDQVRARRGTPLDAFARIRERYNLDPILVSDCEIFILACKYYHGPEHAERDAKLDYERYRTTGVLTEYLWRCADPKVYYKEMHAY